MVQSSRCDRLKQIKICSNLELEMQFPGEIGLPSLRPDWGRDQRSKKIREKSNVKEIRIIVFIISFESCFNEVGLSNPLTSQSNFYVNNI